MSRAGRKLKSGQRSPSGQLRREGRAEKANSSALAPVEVVRMREAAKAKAVDPLWGSELGRLHLQGDINATQLEAGRRWANLSAAHDLAIDAKKMKSPSYGGSDGGTEADPDSEKGRQIAAREANTISKYREVEDKLAAHGDAVVLAIEVLCEDDKPLGWAERRDAIKGLNILCEHWGLTKGRS